MDKPQLFSSLLVILTVLRVIYSNDTNNPRLTD